MAFRWSIGKQVQMLETSAPFVLFEDARAPSARPARLYRQPRDVIEVREPDGIGAALEALDDAGSSGLHAAGFLSYEAGHALEPRLAPLCPRPDDDAPPLLWFGLFEDYEEVARDELPHLLRAPSAAFAGTPEPLISRTEYEASVARIKRHIEAGDIYQANLTFNLEVRTLGHPLSLYAQLRQRARAGHGAVVYTGQHWLLSFSPELFFHLQDDRIVTRPMKGTARRGAGAAEDERAARALQEDPKQRAENLMIVDLLRNDLSRISRPGSVKVPALFEIETYPTVHQMTSTVTGQVEEGVSPRRIIEAIFPCGSITGAPKIRAMEIIDQIEKAPRSIYTGSIGWIEPGGGAEFNVAIRTLAMTDGAKRATMGLGSAIVADSEAGEEWRECLSKGAFVASDTRQFDLVETLRFDPQEGFAELERHLNRLKNSAAELGFSFNRHSARNDLQAASFRLREGRKIRMRLSSSGAVALEGRPLPRTLAEPVKVKVVPLPVAESDFRLRHKTTDRHFYDEARAAAGTFEVVFEDGKGFLTDGSFTNIFVEREGKLLTPPSSRALLCGVLREKLLEGGEAEEADLRLADLSHGFYIGNNVRGLVKAVLKT